MRNIRGRIMLLFGLAIPILFLPVALFLLSGVDAVQNYIQCTFNATPSQLFEALIDYSSLAVTILLGIVVYEQAQKINILEMSQYEIYLGITGIDPDYIMGNVFLAPSSSISSPNEFSVIQVHSDSEKCFQTDLRMDLGAMEKVTLLPLVFTIKSATLATSIHFRKIIFEITKHGGDNECSKRKTFKSKSVQIFNLFENDSNFHYIVGTMIPKEVDIEKAKLTFYATVTDRINRKHKKKICIELRQINDSWHIYANQAQ